MMATSGPISGPGAPTARRTFSRRGLFSALVGGVVVLAIGFGWHVFRVRAERRTALRLARDGDFAQAEPLLRRAAERNPADGAVVAALARGSLASGSAGEDQAADYLTRWCQLRPGDAEPYRLLVKLQRKRHRSEEAVAAGQRAVALAPDDLAARRQLAAAFYESGHFAEAEREWRTCLEHSPGDHQLRVLLAEVRKVRGDVREAATLLDQVLRAAPEDVGALLARAQLFLQTGEPARAIPLLERVLLLDPRHQRTARYPLSLALERVGRHDEARRVLAEMHAMQEAEVLSVAATAQPDNLALKVRAAEALLANGNTAQGLDLLGTVLQRNPDFPPAHRALAAYHEQHGQPARAAEHRRRAGLTPAPSRP